MDGLVEASKGSRRHHERVTDSGALQAVGERRSASRRVNYDQCGAVRGVVGAYWLDLATQSNCDICAMLDELPWLLIAVGLERHLLRTSQRCPEDGWSDLLAFLRSILSSELPREWVRCSDRPTPWRFTGWMEALDVFARGGSDGLPGDLLASAPREWIRRFVDSVGQGGCESRARGAVSVLVQASAGSQQRPRFIRELLSTAAASLPSLPDDCGAALYYRAALVSLWLVDLDQAAEFFDLGVEAAEACRDRTLLRACRDGQKISDRLATVVDGVMSKVLVQHERLTRVLPQTMVMMADS